MDFGLSVEQQTWYDATIAFANERLAPELNLAMRDSEAEFWREGWRRCGEFGLHGLPVPTEYGGKGLGLPETIAAMEGLGYACEDNGLIFAINASLWTNTIPVLRYGTDAQKTRWLPLLSCGTVVGANGASEPEAGSDIFSLRTRATKTESGWVLNGCKTWVTAGPVADVFVCYATSDPAKGVLGISAFIVPKETAGFRVVRDIPKLGLKTVPMGELAFEDCRLPHDALLGREGRGAEVFNCSMEWERGAILAAALGTMRRQLQRCIEHARARHQFGKPIGKFQAVSHRIVAMHVRLETCRPLVYKIGWLKSRGEDATIASAIAKLYVSESYVQNSLDAVQLFGASGYAVETGMERLLRDAIGSTIYSGTSDIQRNIIAAGLGV